MGGNVLWANVVGFVAICYSLTRKIFVGIVHLRRMEIDFREGFMILRKMSRRQRQDWFERLCFSADIDDLVKSVSGVPVRGTPILSMLTREQLWGIMVVAEVNCSGCIIHHSRSQLEERVLVALDDYHYRLEGFSPMRPCCWWFYG